MSNNVNVDVVTSRVGSGGANQPLRFHTFGADRAEILSTVPAMKMFPAGTTPAAPTGTGEGTFFFRNDGTGKAQFCVVFPSGAVQILASEP